VQLLEDLLGRYGLDVVAAYMQHIQDNAADLTARAISDLPDGEHRFEDRLDDGARIAVKVTVNGRAMEIDFTGTDGAVDSNLNAPRAVTMAAVLYVLRLMIGKPIPLNSGCLRPVSIRIPEHSLLSPEPERAVAAGNVETSQRIVDVLLGALRLAAASQGNHEQHHVRRRAPGVLRDARRRLRGDRLAPRRVRRAHTHDELQVHGPRGSGDPLPHPSTTILAATRVGRSRRAARR
jgi:N-methylhydantoinase B/oxoprolinase/acetone carboxylase alpha subunit